MPSALLKYFFPVIIILIGNCSHCQDLGFKFTAKTEKGNYYLLKGNIDGKYKITMKLFLSGGPRCGEEWKAIQWKNGGLDGWYYYDKIGTKIKLTGSFGFDSYGEVKLYVPMSSKDTINAYTCEMENYKEVFVNEDDFDFTKMKWKMKGDKIFKDVNLDILKKPSPNKITVTFELPNGKSKKLDINKLSELVGFDDINIISYGEANNYYHLLFKLENFGWREYQKYIGYLNINDNLELKDFKICLAYDSWNGEEEKISFDIAHPENGVRCTQKNK
ncbi:MAG TPA: hypothetical protein ENJ95_09110 [Bacteroidetes bacterium]|nr:hypothetical protein [Bacteroidota bacterium]